MLDFDFDTEICTRLKALGADPNLMYRGMSDFDMMEVVQPFKPVSKYYKTKLCSVQAQLKGFAAILDQPLADNGLTVLSSFPSDARAKAAALHIFRNAVIDGEDKVRKPRWVTLYNDRFDYEQLRLKRPSLLVISNVMLESTQYKLERLRDILEMFNDIPRIVVTGGTPDPTELMVNRLHLPVSMAVSIGPEHVVKNILELMEL